MFFFVLVLGLNPPPLIVWNILLPYLHLLEIPNVNPQYLYISKVMRWQHIRHVFRGHTLVSLSVTMFSHGETDSFLCQPLQSAEEWTLLQCCVDWQARLIFEAEVGTTVSVMSKNKRPHKHFFVFAQIMGFPNKSGLCSHQRFGSIFVFILVHICLICLKTQVARPLIHFCSDKTLLDTSSNCYSMLRRELIPAP